MCFLALVLGCTTTAPVLDIDQSTDPNPWTHLAFNDTDSNFNFVIVSDRTGGMRPGVFASAIQRVEDLSPEFVMSIGDLIDGYTEDTAVLASQWSEFDSIISDLSMPFFYMAGNHDIWKDGPRRMWEKRRGRDYYHFVYKNALFLCLNSEDGDTAQIRQPQLDYVRKVLAQNADVRWTFVFLHRPLWLWDLIEPTGWAQVEEALGDRPGTIFSGHTHFYARFVRKGREHIGLATTGGGVARSAPPTAKFDHILWVSMRGNTPAISVIKLDGLLSSEQAGEL